jgi:hypothetical protein
MRTKQQTPVLAALVLLTLALAVTMDLFVFPADQLGAGMSASLLNHTLNAGLWFLLLAAPIIVLFMFWQLAIDLTAKPVNKSRLP